MSLAVSAASVSGHAPIRVMVVDDAVVVRGLVSRWIGEEPGLQVVACLRTGRQAVDQVERANPDVVLLDVDMPELDGISALPLLLDKRSEEHTSELQSLAYLVCRLLLEKKKTK